MANSYDLNTTYLFISFKFYCCEVANFTILDCSWTPFVNAYDEDFTYVLDESRILCGVGSEHDNYFE